MRKLLCLALLVLAVTTGLAKPSSAATTPTMPSSQVSFNLDANKRQRFFKVRIPDDTVFVLSIGLSEVNCTKCPLNAELSVRYASRPTNTTYACRSSNPGSGESCSISDPAPGYWYIRVKRISGAGRVSLSALYAMP